MALELGLVISSFLIVNSSAISASELYTYLIITLDASQDTACNLTVSCD